MSNPDDNFNQVSEVARVYFRGLYTADVPLLRGIFHSTATVQAPNLKLTRDEWLERVSTRPVPRDVGSSEGFKILAVDVEQQMAMVKAYCPLFQLRHIDFLTLINENERWHIVNKTYVTLPPQDPSKT